VSELGLTGVHQGLNIDWGSIRCCSDRGQTGIISAWDRVGQRSKIEFRIDKKFGSLIVVWRDNLIIILGCIKEDN